MQKNSARTMGERIRTQRKLKGMSQEDLSFEINVARQTISKWESGTAFPDTHNIYALCEIFEVKFEYFFPADEDEVAADIINDDKPQTKESAIEIEAAAKHKMKMKAHHKFLFIIVGIIFCIVFSLSLIIMISILVAPHNDTTVVSVSFNSSPEYVCGIICGVIVLIVVIFLIYRFIKNRSDK